MNHRRFPSSLFPLPIILVLQVMLWIPQSLGDLELLKECADVKSKCGNISGYPFSELGMPPACVHPGPQLYCENDTPTIEIVDVRYRVLNISSDHQTLRIARQDLIESNLCDAEHLNPKIDYGLFDLVTAPSYVNVTLLYDCPPNPNMFQFNCDVGHRYKDVRVRTEDWGSYAQCHARVTVPILESLLEGIFFNFSLLRESIEEGFEVKWTQDKLDRQVCQQCNRTGGACGFYLANNQTICHCPNANANNPWEIITECPREGSSSKLNLIIGLTVGVTSAILVACTICFIVVRSKGEPSLITKLRNNNASVEEFIKKFGSLAPKRYFYEDIKKMTNKFKDKLGQGGYGSVYRGKLPDGRLVAVKVLSESKGNGEDFMNEVASISRTSHVNIVTLLGFCYDRSKRALVYEFMPHGSLDKFIYNQGSEDRSSQLEWKTLYNIALGIARGLEYLHQGCNTRILHFDIKPHNILLDENFCPKVSDFGLSKLCERKESIISMTGARGTAGYIAPEVFCRSFGGVSHKSDVYSYGMMVLEMVGGRKNINVEVSRTSEIYFPSWIYEHIDQAMNLSLDGVTAEEEEEITRRLTVMSFWCIQTNPRDRPSMTKVLEMLQGSLQSLEIPPRPFVSSPIRSPQTVSTTDIHDH